MNSAHKTVLNLTLLFSTVAGAGESVCTYDAHMTYPMILAYHDQVASDADKIVPQDLTLAEFQNHVKLLRDKGYTFHSLAELWDSLKTKKSLPAKSVILTFDDGYIGNFETAKWLVQEQIKAAFFIIPVWVGRSIPQKKYLTWDQLTEMHTHPNLEIQAHTQTHPHLKTIDVAALNLEYKTAQEELNKHLHLPDGEPSLMAYPYGEYNADAAKVAGNYYRMSFGYDFDQPSSPDFDAKIDPCYQFPRMATEVEYADPQKFYAMFNSFQTQLNNLPKK